MTQFELLPVAAGARIISACFRKVVSRVLFVVSSHERHYFGRGMLLTQQIGHDFYGPVYVVEEGFVPLTQVVQSCLAVWCVDEAIFGATAVAGKTDFAFAAVAGKGSLFVQARLPLFLR